MSKNDIKILVSGGAGYIGSLLVRLLLDEGYSVRVIDSLMFGDDALNEIRDNPSFEFIEGDVRNEADLERALNGIDHVAHLAAIVGDPACAKEPELTKSVNLKGSKLIYKMANEAGVKRFIFASTCSNYGQMENPDEYVTEESALAPVSLYAETKVEVEKYLLAQDRSNVCKPTCLRFSTVYGISPRPRFDLTVNEFTKEIALGRELVIYGEQFWRPYCHVIDLCRSVLSVIESSEEQTAFQVYNVGDTDENYQKKMIVNELLKFFPDASIKYVQKDEDPRDYRVSFEKITSNLDFSITKRVPDGIKEIKEVIEGNKIGNPDDQKYSNV
ncbi:MAG: NAD-dependent epimerase/dehydratase family protein [Bacteroidetes bacterium]|nr:NAD-dependent epimerase/dehydratase family protein [Bacteroidota bacterium]